MLFHNTSVCFNIKNGISLPKTSHKIDVLGCALSSPLSLFLAREQTAPGDTPTLGCDKPAPQLLPAHC